MEEVVTSTGGDSGTKVSSENDTYGYRWMCCATRRALPASKTSRWASTPCPARSRRPHGERLLCAVFAFTDSQGSRSTSSTTTSAATVPLRAGPETARLQERSTECELQIKAQIGAELRSTRDRALVPLWGIRSEPEARRGARRLFVEGGPERWPFLVRPASSAGRFFWRPARSAADSFWRPARARPNSFWSRHGAPADSFFFLVRDQALAGEVAAAS